MRFKRGVKFILPLFFFVLLSSGALAYKISKKWVGYPSVYGSFINYKNSDIKENGYALTGYLSLWYGYFDNLQLGAAYTYIKYKNASDLKQKDFTVVYSNTNRWIRNHIVTLGFHYIDTTDELTDGGKVFLVDVTRYFLDSKYHYYFKWNFGIGGYFSSYDKKEHFNVYQVSPHSTVKLFASPFKGAVYLDLIGYYIHLTKAKEVGLSEKNYYSFEADIRYYKDRGYIKLGGWVGKQVFAVKNTGFVVYNLTEKYKGGIVFGVGHTFPQGLSVGLSLGISSFEEAGKNSVQEVLTGSVSYHF